MRKLFTLIAAALALVAQPLAASLTTPQTLPATLRQAKARINFTGDSKGQEPLQALYWIMARGPLLVEIGQGINVGGSGTGSLPGPTSNPGQLYPSRIAQLQAMVQADVAAGYASDLVDTIGTNDTSSASGETLASTQIVANVQKLYGIFKAAGGRYFILMSMDPRGSATAQASLNVAYARWAKDTPDVIFVDTTPFMLDPASSTGAPIGGAAQTAGALMDNGPLHDKGYGDYVKGLALEPAMRRLYAPKAPRVPIQSEAYNVSSAPNASLLGNQGRAIAIGGTDSTTKAGSAAVTGTPPAGWTATGSLDGSLAITFAAVNSSTVGALYGGIVSWPVVRVTFAGTPTSTGSLCVAKTLASGQPANTIFRYSALLNFNDSGSNPVKGLVSVKLSDAYVGLSGRVGTATADASLVGADVIVQAKDGLHYLEYAGSYASSVSSGFGGPSLCFRWFAGQAVSGDVGLIGASVVRDDLPAPTP